MCLSCASFCASSGLQSPYSTLPKLLSLEASLHHEAWLTWLDLLQDNYAEGDQITVDAKADNGDSAASQHGPDDSSSASPVQAPVSVADAAAVWVVQWFRCTQVLHPWTGLVLCRGG